MSQLMWREQLVSLMENASDAIILMSNKGTIVHANNAYEQIFGWTAQETNLNGGFLLSQPASKELRSYWVDVCNGQHISGYETAANCKDGREIYISITLSPINDTNGFITGIGAIIRDITKSKLAQIELMSMKALLDSIYQNTLDAICVVDSERRVVGVNQAFENLYGYSVNDLIGKDLPIIRECDFPFQQEVHATVHEGQKLTFDTICLHKNGTAIDVEVTMGPLYDLHGNVIGSAGIARDITERKLAQERLRQSEEKYRLIADNTLDLILVTDRTGFVQYASPSHKLNLGVEPSSLDGTNLWTASFIHTEDLPQIMNLYSEILTTKVPGRITTRLKRQNGDWLIYEMQASPVIAKDNAVNSVVLVARDITELEKTQEIFRKSEKLSVAGQLAAGIAHEIRNPLTSIKGFIQIMQSGIRRDEYLDIMISEINRMETIISEFLLLARPQTINVKQTKLDALLTSTIQLVNTHAIFRNVQIAYSPYMDHIMLDCDENQMKQVFINILKNSIESMPEGGLISVETTMLDRDTMKVSFQDTGCGIPEDRLIRLGEPFYSTKEKGTGLGLMISYKIIKEHHGKLTIQSEVNKGTTVDIMLPVYHERAAVEQSPEIVDTYVHG